MAYLDDIIIYLDTEGEHKKHVKWVLKTLSKKNISIAIKKMQIPHQKNQFCKIHY